ncbi:hypothetical protein [Brevundimonas sp. R86498]|uniref:hypothetical protein n=1 Tax=Brevundimonas sp. R86498 TaxID=3093845 RepID=UPI0037CCA2A1
MSDTPPRPEAEGAPAEPFVRGRIQWSRPPQTVFRVGPLPEAPVPLSTPRLTGIPLRKPGGGVLSGSMIPTARPAAPEPAVPETTPERPAPPPEPELLAEPTPLPEPAPEPVPQPRPEPAPQPAPRVEQVVEVEAVEMVETVPPLAGEAPPVAEPRSLPSVVVTPTLYATVSAAVQTVKPRDRWTFLVVAVVAVAVTAGFVWLATLPGGGSAPLDLDAPPPAAVSAPPPA